MDFSWKTYIRIHSTAVICEKFFANIFACGTFILSVAVTYSREASAVTEQLSLI